MIITPLLASIIADATAPTARRTLSPERRAEVIENLRDEFDILCRGTPSAHDIDAALRAAEMRL